MDDSFNELIVVPDVATSRDRNGGGGGCYANPNLNYDYDRQGAGERTANSIWYRG